MPSKFPTMALQPSATTGLQRRYVCSIGSGEIDFPGYKDESVIFTCYSCATKIGLDRLHKNTVTDCSGAGGKHLVLVDNKNPRSKIRCAAWKFDKLSVKERLVRDHDWYKGYVQDIQASCQFARRGHGTAKMAPLTTKMGGKRWTGKSRQCAVL